MLVRDGYPAGVPCWIDVVEADPDATMAFYGDLFGWTYQVRTPSGAPQRYAHALLDGLVVAGVGGPPTGESEPTGWMTYVWVDSVDGAAGAVEANGGRVAVTPVDIPHAGRVAVCTDPSGAGIGLWQARENRGVQMVNAPGSWNFSELRTADPGRVEPFYRAVFGWESEPLGMGDDQQTWMWRLPGYGDFLAERDPDIRGRQETDQAPSGFADAVALMQTVTVDGRVPTTGDWTVTFAVADADAAVARAVGLGATVVTPLFDTAYTRMATIQDPQGGVITLSQYRPPGAA